MISLNNYVEDNILLLTHLSYFYVGSMSTPPFSPVLRFRQFSLRQVVIGVIQTPRFGLPLLLLPGTFIPITLFPTYSSSQYMPIPLHPTTFFLP